MSIWKQYYYLHGHYFLFNYAKYFYGLSVVIFLIVTIYFLRSRRTAFYTQIVLCVTRPFVVFYFLFSDKKKLLEVYSGQFPRRVKIKVFSGWLGSVYRPLLGFEVRGYVARDNEPSEKIKSVSSVLDRQIALFERTKNGHLRFYFSGPGFSSDVGVVTAAANKISMVTPCGVISVDVVRKTPSIVFAARSGYGKTTAIRSIVAPFQSARKIYVGRYIDKEADGERIELTDEASVYDALGKVKDAVAAVIAAEKSNDAFDGLRLILVLDEFSNWSDGYKPPKGEDGWHSYTQRIINEVCRRNRILVITTTQSGRAGTMATDSMAIFCGELTAAGQAETLTGVDFSLPCPFSFYQQGFHGVPAGVVVLPAVTEQSKLKKIETLVAGQKMPDN